MLVARMTMARDRYLARLAELLAFLTLIALLCAPAVQAAYPGANGKVGYVWTEVGNSDVAFVRISSIPSSSAANCNSDSSGLASCAIGRASYSPDGKAIVAARVSDHGSLELLGANGQGVHILSRLTSDDEDPAFLPGGEKIVFSGTVNHQTNLYEVRINGTGLKQMTARGGSWPAPCPNGAIAFVGGNGLYIMGVHGRVRRLARGSVSTPDCAPDSRRILYSDAGGGIDTVAAKGGKPTRVRHARGSNPVYAPDGRFIAYVTNVYAQDLSNLIDEVWVSRLDGKVVSRDEVGNVVTSAGALTWQPRPKRRAR